MKTFNEARWWREHFPNSTAREAADLAIDKLPISASMAEYMDTWMMAYVQAGARPRSCTCVEIPRRAADVYVAFARHNQHLPDRGRGLPPPLTWDRPRQQMGPPILGRDLAVVTCLRQHTTRVTTRNHVVLPDGRVHPSYVCTASGCDFHRMIRLLDWAR